MARCRQGGALGLAALHPTELVVRVGEEPACARCAAPEPLAPRQRLEERPQGASARSCAPGSRAARAGKSSGKAVEGWQQAGRAALATGQRSGGRRGGGRGGGGPGGGREKLTIRNRRRRWWRRRGWRRRWWRRRRGWRRWRRRGCWNAGFASGGVKGGCDGGGPGTTASRPRLEAEAAAVVAAAAPWGEWSETRRNLRWPSRRRWRGTTPSWESSCSPARSLVRSRAHGRGDAARAPPDRRRAASKPRAAAAATMMAMCEAPGHKRTRRQPAPAPRPPRAGAWPCDSASRALVPFFSNLVCRLRRPPRPCRPFPRRD